MVNSKSKGGSYEREIAKKLSNWYTNGSDPNLFYRTGGSGSRGKTNIVGVHNQYGDIMAVGARGHDLMNMCIFELKKGYGQWDILSLLDGTGTLENNQLLKFLDEVYEDVDIANEKTEFYHHPIVIARRNRKKDIIVLEKDLLPKIFNYDQRFTKLPRITINNVGEKYRTIHIMNLDDFLDNVDPAIFTEIANEK